MQAWTQKHVEWIKTAVKFDQPAQQATLDDYVSEVEHLRQRIVRLEKTIDEVLEKMPAPMREVIEALQVLRGVAKLTAVTVVAEVGKLSRFKKARQLMGYSGAVSSEHSSGEKTRRGGITKTGNSHLRRVVVEAAWSYRFKPALGWRLRERQRNQSAEVIEIATQAQHRLHRHPVIAFVHAGDRRDAVVIDRPDDLARDCVLCGQ